MRQRKGNLKRKTKCLIIAAQNNAIRTNHTKARIDKTQQNSRCDDRDETTNYIISECSKLVLNEYKTRHDMNKWYMHNPASVLKNETHNLLWNFEIKIDHLISAR